MARGVFYDELPVLPGDRGLGGGVHLPLEPGEPALELLDVRGLNVAHHALVLTENTLKILHLLKLIKGV